MSFSNFRITVLTLSAVLVVGTSACASADSYEGVPALELWELGKREYAEEDWDDAIEALDRLVLTYNGFDSLPQARMMLARAHFQDEKYVSAQAEFTRFLDRYGTHPMVPEAALGVCRSVAARSPIYQRDQQATEQAALVCGNVARDYATHEISEEADSIANAMRKKLALKAYQNSMFYFEQNFWDSAVIYFEMVVDEFGDTEYAPKSMMRIIEAYREIGYEDEVETWRQRLLNSYPDSDEARALINGEQGDGEDPDVGR